MDSKATFTWYISLTKLSVDSTHPTKTKGSHWLPKITTAPGNTRWTHKVSPAIKKFAIKKSAKCKILKWFHGVKNRWADRYEYSVKSHSGSRLTHNSITGSIYNIKRRPSNWVPTYVCEWTVRSTYCNSGNAIRSRWHYVQRKIHSHDKPYKLFDRSLIPTTQQYNTRYASRDLEFSLLFNAKKTKIGHPQMSMNPV